MNNSLGLERKKSSSALKALLVAWLTAGTMDILAALLVYTVIMSVTTAPRILQSIASGVFGKDAFAGGNTMAIYGVIFHYLIAFSWTLFYFFAARYVAFLRTQPIVSGLLYGIFVWIMMNLVVLPLSSVSRAPLTLSGAALGAGILMICIGLPIALILNKLYFSKR